MSVAEKVNPEIIQTEKKECNNYARPESTGSSRPLRRPAGRQANGCASGSAQQAGSRLAEQAGGMGTNDTNEQATKFSLIVIRSRHAVSILRSYQGSVPLH